MKALIFLPYVLFAFPMDLSEYLSKKGKDKTYDQALTDFALDSDDEGITYGLQIPWNRPERSPGDLEAIPTRARRFRAMGFLCCCVEGCGEVFFNQTELDSHLDCHFEGTGVCEVKVNADSQKKRKKPESHIKKSEDIFVVGGFPCSIEGCKIVLGSERSRDRHVEYYHREEKLECGVDGCTRSYRYPHKLVEHKKNKHGIMPTRERIKK